MSWADPTDMDTLSELPLHAPPKTMSRGRSSKRSHQSSVGGGSRSERRLLMEAKAGVGAAIAEERKERMIAKRRARKCVKFLYYAFKVLGVAACFYTSGLNATMIYMRPELKLQDKLVRSYLVFFGIGGVLAELDTPFAKANFRAMQKWWFKAPFYVFMAWLCLDVRHARRTVWFSLELAAFIALQAMAMMSVVLNVCLREVLERSGALGKRKGKKSRRRRASSAASSSRGGGGTGGKKGKGAGGGRGASPSAGGLGVSSFRERDRRRPRPSSVASSSPRLGANGNVQGASGPFGDRHAPEMVPERGGGGSGRLLASPTASSYAGSSRFDPYAASENGSSVGFGGGGGGGAGGGLGEAISGKIKWWLDRGGDGDDGDEDQDSSPPRGRRRHAEDPLESPASSASVSTARSGRTNWWEDSDGDDDGTSSFVSYARDDTSDAGSVMSGYTSASAGSRAEYGGRYGSVYGNRGPGGIGVRRAASVSSRRTAGGNSLRGGLEQRPPPLTMHGGGGGGGGGGAGGGAAGEGSGGASGGQHVALTAQALARNSNEGPSGIGRGSGGFAGGSASNYAGSVHEGSVAGSAFGGLGGGSVRGFGARRTGRRPAWEAGASSNRAASVSGEAPRGSATGWSHGAPDYDLGPTASELGGDDDRGDDGRHPRPGMSFRRTPGVQDYTPF